MSCFYTAPALNARLFNVAGAAPTLAGATTTAAIGTTAVSLRLHRRTSASRLVAGTNGSIVNPVRTDV